MPSQLNAFETEKLLEYKLYQLNLDSFSQRVNENFHKNGGTSGTICYELTCNTDEDFSGKCISGVKRVARTGTYFFSGKRNAQYLYAFSAGILSGG